MRTLLVEFLTWENLTIFTPINFKSNKSRSEIEN